jgi:hypothetical protein
MIDIKIKSETFTTDVEKIVAGGSKYLDAILRWADEKGVEMEYISSLIDENPAIRLKLQREAEDLHFLKKARRVRI